MPMLTDRPARPTALLLIALALAPAPAPGQAPARLPRSSLDDPRLADLRRASAEWDLRGGPQRRVVDQVCLVPDVATFYEALAAWDDRHAFPILIDDADLVLKFLQAFRPSRVVRYPGRGRPIEDGQAWDRARAAVAASWTAADAPAGGDSPPKGLGRTPPGVVVASAKSPALPGLVALAAGRFQPLIRLESPKGYSDLLNADDLRAFLDSLDAAILEKVPGYRGLGDDCDFITLAGDYPYRYSGERGAMAVDDRVARSPANSERWAFAGRLIGDEKRSVYAAMCSLFLRPESALLFDGYPNAPPFSDYTLRAAPTWLRPFLPTTLVVGEGKGTIQGWRGVMGGLNRFGLVLINTKGMPSYFDLPGGVAHAFEVMPSVPAAVSIIHSYSAADPTDPRTIGGRWLAQGAFVYFGSMDEPYLSGFRTPALYADLLAAGLPFAAAMRKMPGEALGQPWKLVVLGDPLYRPLRRGPEPPRAADLAATAGWTAYAEAPAPGPDAPDSARLAWTLNAAIVGLTTARARPADPVDLLAVLRPVDRQGLAPRVRPILDDLSVVLAYRARRMGEVRDIARKIPAEERSPTVVRLAISAGLVDLHAAIDRRDYDRAVGPWLELMRLDAEKFFYEQATAGVGSIADTPPRRDDWRKRLLSARDALGPGPAAEVVAEELKKRR